MKKLMLFVPFFCMVSVAAGKVSPRVWLADANMPLLPVDSNFPHVYRDITVGIKLKIIVDSNVAEDWSGSLAIADANMDYGVLSARDYDGFGYPGSCLSAAGEGAAVYDWEEAGIDGFDLYTGFMDIEAGDWFIIDYTATDIGTCHVEFYDHSVNLSEPNYYLTFSHVLTQDFDKSTRVDFIDFAALALYWQTDGCSNPNFCKRTDLNFDGNVDHKDLKLFADYWLEETDKRCHNLGFK